MARAYFLLIFALLVCPASLSAEIRLFGTFTATEACPALHGKKMRDNPGHVETEPGTTYSVKAINSAAGSHFRIDVLKLGKTRYRWVAASCGIFRDANGTVVDAAQLNATSAIRPRPLHRSEQNSLVLRLSGEDCDPDASSDATRVSDCDAPIFLTPVALKPLPPDKVYCGIAPDVEDADRNAGPDQDPRIRYGSCFDPSGDPALYHATLDALFDQIQRSTLPGFLQARKGQRVRTEAIRTAFDAAYGQGAGHRIGFHCSENGNRVLIDQIQISLAGAPSPSSDISDLIQSADPVFIGCQAGILALE